MKKIIILMLFALSLPAEAMEDHAMETIYPLLRPDEVQNDFNRQSSMSTEDNDELTKLDVEQQPDVSSSDVSEASRSLYRRFFRALNPHGWSERSWAAIGKVTWLLIGAGGVATGLTIGLNQIPSSKGCPPFHWNRTEVPTSLSWGETNWLVTSCQRDWMPEFSNTSCVPIVKAPIGPIQVQTGPDAHGMHGNCTFDGKDAWYEDKLYAACPSQTWHGYLKQLLTQNNIAHCDFPVEDGVQIVVRPGDKEWVIDNHFYNFIATHPELVHAKKCKAALKIVKEEIHRFNTLFDCSHYPDHTHEYKELMKNME